VVAGAPGAGKSTVANLPGHVARSAARPDSSDFADTDAPGPPAATHDSKIQPFGKAYIP